MISMVMPSVAGLLDTLAFERRDPVRKRWQAIAIFEKSGKKCGFGKADPPDFN